MKGVITFPVCSGVLHQFFCCFWLFAV